ncbi:MAG TPA: D-aminoacyl-tRNA deacylase [Bacillota bacterium]|nr:D-tyrosyl-tRNA(Tyr) deacylase [Bacillota bacterium]HOB86622.1 D-aminoacyl-tRNA deacylase [Bacillota bacterium]HOP69834.1 D-aminoacyl-tRNA deacylase [Bacillota bacterium]HPT34832.1 D-aminoacyl-tRNA deacylase [Bacillota bacterium]HQD05506.1 D-aminoacyl-tRNA deacylase [Bacillota bacterium]
MRAVVQRVHSASVEVGAETVGSIGRGLVVFLGVGVEDLPEDALYLAQKVAGLRIFEDQAGRMNLSLQEVGGAVLSVSQFTLYGDCRKGRRPSFGEAAPPERAEELYQRFNDELRKQGVEVATGRFQALMRVRVDNDGPVTILLDSRKRF